MQQFQDMPRIKFLRNVILAALGLIVVRLFFIQVIEHDIWVEKASAQQTLLETIVAKRGDIYMMDGEEPVITAGASLSAMYYCNLRYIRGEEGYLHTMFFSQFKKN